MALQLIRRGGTISGILIAVESLIALTPWAGGGGGTESCLLKQCLYRREFRSGGTEEADSQGSGTV